MENLEGTIITSVTGQQYFLSSIVGQGAQGIIYSTSDDKYVIKLYKKESDIKNQNKLKKLNWLMKVNYPDQFIKPIDIIESPYIGYVMQKVQKHISLNKMLIPNREESFSKWYNDSTGGLYRRLLIGSKIARQFANLHRQNMAYCDISGSNILVNEDTNINSVCMIDIDNIYIPGADDVNALGTSRYMAPEILTQQMNPDIFTDSCSLAIILFELLKAGHPYIGDFIEDGTPEQMTEAYKGLYPYVDDPAEDMNRSSQMLPSDVVFTTDMKNLFEKTFIAGKENRLERVRAQEYALAFQKASNLVVKCDSCGNWHYAKSNKQKKYLCPWCDAPYEKPLRIAFYEKYNYKINNQRVPVKDKHLEDFVLKRNSKNVITKNYIKDTYAENDDEALEEYFMVRLAKDGQFYLINQNGNMVAIRKNGEEKFLPVKKGETKVLGLKDTIIFANPSTMKSFDLEKNIKGVSFRYAVIK